MSYMDLADQLEVVMKHIKKGSNTVNNLSNFFKGYKKILESFNNSLQKITEGITIEIQDDSSTLEIAMNGFYNFFKKYLNEQSLFSKTMQLEIIEPLELFLEQYSETVDSYMNSADTTYRQLSKSKEEMLKKRKKYYKHSASAEKAEKSNQVDDKLTKNLAQLKVFVGKSNEDYTKSVENVNKLIEEFHKTVPNIMESLQKNEESRIYFVKSSLEKFIKQYNKTQFNLKDLLEHVSGLASNVNSGIDIQVFVDTHKSRYKNIVKEEVISYQKWKDKRKELNDTPKDFDENYEEILEKAVNFLFSGEETDSDSSMSEIEQEEQDFGKISEAFKARINRNMFLEYLESKKHKPYLGVLKINILVSYLKALLTTIVIEDDKDPYIFCKIVSLIHYFYTETNSKRKYLSQLVSFHSIWSDKIRWVEAIQQTISQKISSDKESIKKIAKPIKKKTGLFGTLKSFANRIPTAFQKDNMGDEAEKTAAFIVITQFSFYMTQLDLGLDVANSIILMCCQTAGLDSNRTCTLLAELEANQRSSLVSFTPTHHSLSIRGKERKRFGKCLAIGLALDFLTPKESLCTLAVCKQWKKELRIAVLKKSLIEWNLPEKNFEALRKTTWVELLKSHLPDIDYKAFLNRVTSSPNLEIEEVISLDVSRSYQNSSIVPSEALKNILKVYAFYNPEVGYCQGMNYIAGTIYSLFQQEDLSLKFMIALIEKFQMKELFTNELAKLKQYFYVLDRLIGIELPQLHEIFKQVNISSAHFCAPWFITLFASHLQNRPYILGSLWDLFLFDGWKTMFKAGIVILKRMSGQLIGTKFEDIMMALASVQGSSPLVEVFEPDFIAEVSQVSLTNCLLNELEAEYLHLRKRAEKYTKK